MAPKCPAPKRHGAELSTAESAAPSRRRRNGGAETAAPKWPSPDLLGLWIGIIVALFHWLNNGSRINLVLFGFKLVEVCC